jgi:hypothetical protein
MHLTHDARNLLIDFGALLLHLPVFAFEFMQVLLSHPDEPACEHMQPHVNAAVITARQN